MNTMPILPGSPPTGVIFDVDGVLIDSYCAHLESWQQLAREQACELTEQQFASTFGRTTRETIRELWGPQLEAAGKNLTDDGVAAMDLRKEALFRDLIARHFPAMEGAAELLESLSLAGVALAAGSSAPALNVEAILKQVDPMQRIEVRISGDDVTRGKPDPQVFQLAAQSLGMAPENCVVVEDAAAGVEAAHAAGMRCIAVTSTGRTAEELSAAERIVTSLSHITLGSLGVSTE